jgi:hypothetical protein
MDTRIGEDAKFIQDPRLIIEMGIPVSTNFEWSSDFGGCLVNGEG